MRAKPVLLILVLVLAFGLVAAGCGSDDSSDSGITSLEDVTVPEDAQDAIDEAEQQLEDAQDQIGDLPGSVDEAVQQCIDQADSTGLPEDQIQNLKDLCQSAADSVNGN
jgi:peptidoglycan hydrolase CwlO-like protein